MTDETLLSAARRLLRHLDINNNGDGGLITNDTCLAAEALRRQIEKEMKGPVGERERAQAEADAQAIAARRERLSDGN